MKYSLLVFLLLIVLSGKIFPQKVKIEKIHDTNLFELEDGTLVKLAGVDAPSTNHPDSSLIPLTDEIMNYAGMTLPYGMVNVEYTGETTPDSISRYAYISRGNLFYTVFFNEIYLERGYGKFIDNVDSLHRTAYQQPEKEAGENNRGIWRYRWQGENVILDYSCYSAEMELADIIPEYYYDRSTGRILMELVGAPVTGFLVAIPAAWIATGFGTARGWDGFGQAMLGGSFGYIVGNSLGVYFVAKGGNKDLSIWGTLLSGVAGTAVGGGIAYLIQKSDYAWIPAAAGITLGPVIYVNLVAPPPSREDEEYSYSKPTVIQEYSHKDFYNSTIVYQHELFRINF